jgi:hypothetical protein
MARKPVRTGILAVVLAGATVMSTGLPAHAAGPEPEVLITTYFSNAQHSRVVGQRVQNIIGCSSSTWGSTSSYVTAVVVQGCG